MKRIAIITPTNKDFIEFVYTYANEYRRIKQVLWRTTFNIDDLCLLYYVESVDATRGVRYDFYINLMYRHPSVSHLIKARQEAIESLIERNVPKITDLSTILTKK